VLTVETPLMQRNVLSGMQIALFTKTIAQSMYVHSRSVFHCSLLLTKLKASIEGNRSA
jgi:hypothetical protein